MVANKHKWDLFILALSSLMSVSQDDALSYYQIAGVLLYYILFLPAALQN